MASEAAVIMRRRSAHFIRARRALEAFHDKAGYMTASVLLRVSVQRPLGIGGGSIYLANHQNRCIGRACPIQGPRLHVVTMACARRHVAVLLPPLHRHGRDSTWPEIVDTGRGDEEVIPLLDPHSLVIDPHLNRWFIGPNRPASVPRAGSAPGPPACRSRPLGLPRRNPALRPYWD